MYNFIKRIIDFLISLVFLPIVLILTIFIGVAIKIDDKGPIFYKAERIGYKGKIFKMLKFRSMKVNSPDLRYEDGSTYNSDNDFRVTRVGKFLRKTSLDEIPQLINVFLGQMAIIGPRPDSASYLSEYTEEEKIILNVRPGITGYNQAINRNSVLTKEKLKNDIYYVKNMSIILDLKVFIWTIKEIIFSKNVYRDSENNIEMEAKIKNENINDTRSEHSATSSDKESERIRI